MEIKCLIIEDEPAAIRIIESYSQNINYLNIIGKCKTANEAISFLNKNDIDLLFLDINMPGMNGIDFYKALRNPPLAIITTAYREYAVESFELEIIDYLHKPFSFNRFYKAVQRAEDKLQANQKNKPLIKQKPKDHIFIKADKKLHKVAFHDILFIESTGDYCKFITTSKNYISHITLKKLTEILPDSFIRVHKSFIIQFDKIDLIEGNTIIMHNMEIPIGYSYRAEFQKLLSYKIP
ncbi:MULTISPECIES: LytTR family DNA-binding domain-containing protein [unclassified Lentimicrobium]|uniref:LytR/AlgR family response regulator transcription factor n=1 Tax=unclassified Lentimicrobium TaxID=2677434 RepID=UPI001557D967|nr:MULTISPECIES: LytTR family DNA-binding domain-containing protein [unclassified Lentimicrobium]NPD44673.1 response regulator transcription factor [Lentimicrobium sp. S6]NPD85853.1 response regulator transcription factor [Lentimicrobium sp. L6]